jgi:hypothetical protein
MTIVSFKASSSPLTTGGVDDDKADDADDDTDNVLTATLSPTTNISI